MGNRACCVADGLVRMMNFGYLPVIELKWGDKLYSHVFSYSPALEWSLAGSSAALHGYPECPAVACTQRCCLFCRSSFDDEIKTLEKRRTAPPPPYEGYVQIAS